MSTPPKPRRGQAAFADALLNPDAPPPDDVAKVDGRPAEKRFAVYRNNVVVSLIAALAAAYPTSKKLVGEQFFDAMAGVFVRAHPPQSPLMMFYGAEFPDWIDQFPPAATVPYLGDVARVERARREAYHAADAEPLDPSRFQHAVAGVSQERVAEMVFLMHPSLRLVRSAHPVFSIWADANGHEMEVTPGGEDVLVVRPRDEVTMRALPPGAFTFLTALSREATLAEAASRAAADTPAFDLGANLAGLLESGAAAELRL